MPKQQLQPGLNPMLVDQSESSGDNDNDSLSQSSFEENSLNADSNSGDQNSSNDGMNHEMKEIYDLAQEDTRNLRAWRIVIVLILVSTFTGVIAGIVAILKKQHSSDCEIAYEGFTASVQEAMDEIMEDYKLFMGNLAESVTISKNESIEFPFVRVPNFELLGNQTRSLLGNDIVLWAPFVAEDQLTEWSSFTVAEQGWYDESLSILQSDSSFQSNRFVNGSKLRDYIWEGDELSQGKIAVSPGPFAPLWHISPPTSSMTSINYNILHETYINDLIPAFLQTRDYVMSGMTLPSSGLSNSIVDSQDLNSDEKRDRPYTTHLTPVFGLLNDVNSPLVGFLLSTIIWEDFLTNIFHHDEQGITAVLRNTCNQVFTYTVQGGQINYAGTGDLHDPVFDGSQVTLPMSTFLYNETASSTGHCIYSLSMYKSIECVVEQEKSNTAFIISILVTISFVVMGVTFVMYDRFVNKRNEKIVTAAARSNAIISSLFPTQVRERLFAAKDDKYGSQDYATTKTKLKKMLTSGDLQNDMHDDDDDSNFMYKTKPIADLFPETTILFADIVGFTAWSSVREPTQVFILLETIYRAFDEIAKKRRVFKVETVGDCYVAVTGLPDPRKDHAIAMARFSRECMLRMKVLVRKLEVTLGPDTGDLSMRMGLHSGPVTAGVLRGERSRFQLFGDTMNTAARMEHTGLRDKIQMSQETADLLIAAGKTTWVTHREDVVVAKGKGVMQTYWLEVSPKDGQSVADRKSSSGGSDMEADQKMLDVVDTNNHAATTALDPKATRLVDWNADVLLRLIKQIVARRNSCPLLPAQKAIPHEERYATSQGTSPLDEVKEIITLPGFVEANYQEDPEDVVLPKEVSSQLHDYISKIAGLYRNNPFHNFEHASHVTMSVVKLLSRIVAPQQLEDDSESYHDAMDIASTLHDHTYGITSDPLTQFSCVLSALIHDIDHPGVPNVQLVKEGHEVATQYNKKSPAEQHSVDLAWDLLMEDQYTELRSTIYQTDAELIRFRQLLVNSVMATDIADKELKVLRNLRWDRAFSSVTVDGDQRDTINRKATIVIEHLIQASDVAHTMQHWHIYRKWNERFFMECYQAYKDGRAEKNPADGWYEGEIGFYDYYIVPLAKKLKDCGVFGVSSDEYLNYAIKNRQEWEARGREVVTEMLEMATSSGN